MKRWIRLLWVLAFSLALAGVAFGEGADEDPVENLTEEKRTVFAAGGFFAEYPENIIEAPDSDVRLVAKRYNPDTFPQPDFAIAQPAINRLRLSPPNTISLIRPLFDLDLHVGNGKKSIQDFLSAGELESEENQILFQFKFSDSDREFIEGLKANLPDENKDERSVFLLFWTKQDPNTPEKGFWETDLDLMERNEISDVKFHNWGFSFKILVWPGDDRAIAVGG